MRDPRRVLLLLLLAVSLDLSATTVPTPSGLQWDDEEEAVHLRRPPRASPPASTVATTAGEERRDTAAHAYSRRPHRPSRSPARVVLRPHADLSSHDPAAPSDDH
ncbi:MAG: hypothetical protein DMD83_18895 [Candidatus Rokuibacteriota bacterium]|nr:MAG: hypothetical protein DMD83_18895 [Candidatus Rokubacteria bacterium]